jgi:threonylcarbamoyladenosine tRNA methylthiotransferase MtaB
VGCYAQLKPEELAAEDGTLVLGATEKFKILDYINDLSKMIWARSIPEIKADFYVEAIRLVTEHA